MRQLARRIKSIRIAIVVARRGLMADPCLVNGSVVTDRGTVHGTIAQYGIGSDESSDRC
jgi:hypothetical protein